MIGPPPENHWIALEIWRFGWSGRLAPEGASAIGCNGLT
jgi:hypothetical protein